ncbi:YvrJ family protein [Peptoniphilus equinus]|uniref:YvrJ family protein n=1 Tax=Peptoniphilus equinus TaxID=3016343 RepID=A0ABY7QUP6_9FIRM|nr:YvrJ family protein [Peptoniphilus equinus]WBW49750.1 YvrJ family protein [Peptoniphilus equinus]
MDELISLVGNVGFPIAVSCYLLIRVEKRIIELTHCIQTLSANISHLS